MYSKLFKYTDRLGDLPDRDPVWGRVWRRVRTRVAARAEQLESYAPAVIEFALAPYLGSEEARKIATEGYE
jgi:hypothetical protein